MTLGRQALTIALWLGTAPVAQAELPTEVTIDLDGDGRPETWLLFPGAGWTADLEIMTHQGPMLIDGFAWSAQLPETMPYFEVEDNAFQIVIRNHGFGPPWTQTLHIAQGPVIERISYDWYDRIDPDKYGGCEITPEPPLELSDWPAYALPAECFDVGD